jgi:hypothetical protein
VLAADIHSRLPHLPFPGRSHQQEALVCQLKYLPSLGSQACLPKRRRGYLYLGPGWGIHLAKNEMNGKLITGLNNCLSVSHVGCPSHSRCCAAGLKQEGDRRKQTKNSVAKTKARLQGWKGIRMGQCAGAPCGLIRPHRCHRTASL